MKKIEKSEAVERQDIIGDFMAGISPAVKRSIERKMDVAVAIADALERKRWSQKEFAERLGKRESEISKWLSGKQNFTLDTLGVIEDALGIDLIHVGALPVQTAMPQPAIPSIAFRYMDLRPSISQRPIPAFSRGIPASISILQSSLQPLVAYENRLQPC